MYTPVGRTYYYDKYYYLVHKQCSSSRNKFSADIVDASIVMLACGGYVLIAKHCNLASQYGLWEIVYNVLTNHMFTNVEMPKRILLGRTANGFFNMYETEISKLKCTSSNSTLSEYSEYSKVVDEVYGDFMFETSGNNCTVNWLPTDHTHPMIFSDPELAEEYHKGSK